MNREIQLQLAAYLDGELPAAELRAVEAKLREHAVARDLLAELRQTRSLLSGNELKRPLPEGGDFYWSKIAHQIEREGVRPEPVRTTPAWLTWLRPVFSPVGGAASFLALVVIAFVCYSNFGTPETIHESEADQPDAQMLTFRDHQAGMTVIWLSYRE